MEARPCRLEFQPCGTADGLGAATYQYIKLNNGNAQLVDFDTNYVIVLICDPE